MLSCLSACSVGNRARECVRESVADRSETAAALACQEREGSLARAIFDRFYEKAGRRTRSRELQYDVVTGLALLGSKRQFVRCHDIHPTLGPVLAKGVEFSAGPRPQTVCSIVQGMGSARRASSS